MFRQQMRARYALTFLMIAVTGCSTNCPRKLTSNDLNEYGLISGSLTNGSPGGIYTATSFLLSFRNIVSGKNYKIASGRFFDEKLIDEDSIKGDVYVKQLPPGDYEFETCNIYYQQTLPAPGGTTQKTAYIPITISSPFSVRTGEIQYLGELRFNLDKEVVPDEDPSWLFGPQDEEYLHTSARHLDSYSRDIGILQSKYPDIAWQNTRRSPGILSGSVLQQVASDSR